MKSEAMPLIEWSRRQESPIYALLAGASEAAPLQHYYQLDGSHTPRGLYLGTPYHDWLPVMPYIVPVNRESPFIEWAAQTGSRDWGWLLATDQPIDTLYAHLQGLTQIWHLGEAVFFRYWDGFYLSTIVKQLGDGFTALLPELSALWCQGQAFSWGASEPHEVRPFPWWALPPDVAIALSKHDVGPLINNLMQQLADSNGQLYWSFPEANLRCKVARFVARHSSPDIDLFPALEAALINEVQA
ncbi:DUF4123 domain-containing protein [Aeromonas simiae]|uniref:DUF4123 domain-containing protein n=1 Tax=Aeromonas simiae TaxID=218936 RepID=UPI00266D1213|nr:DUF4123 domain-containing protein [Aeromonas simiae]MDO2950024.1 DUF4123 domain-containing protein [Aeromonas simiae]MDO2953976.1 DUF4123 domain-containing protein [Aeromonas simiae]MDO2957399.1 DUF4123 domain-containing protein [Aeromonas simiae]